MPRKPETFKPTRRPDRARAAERLYDVTRGSAASRGYDRRWRKVRNNKLGRDPLCEHCLEMGRPTPAVDVDHVKPIKLGGARYSMRNLQSLCRSCHNRKTRAGE